MFQELCKQLTLRLSVCKRKVRLQIYLNAMTWLSKLGINETPYADIMLQQKNSIVKTWEAKKRHIEDNSVFGIIARDVKY